MFVNGLCERPERWWQVADLGGGRTTGSNHPGASGGEDTGLPSKGRGPGIGKAALRTPSLSPHNELPAKRAY